MNTRIHSRKPHHPAAQALSFCRSINNKKGTNPGFLSSPIVLHLRFWRPLQCLRGCSNCHVTVSGGCMRRSSSKWTKQILLEIVFFPPLNPHTPFCQTLLTHWTHRTSRWYSNYHKEEEDGKYNLQRKSALWHFVWFHFSGSTVTFIFLS